MPGTKSGTLRAYDFDGVLASKHHHNAVTSALNRAIKGSGNFPNGTRNIDEALDLLRANPIGAAAREWVDPILLRAGVGLFKSQGFIDTLVNTHNAGGDSIIVSASGFPGLINYLVDKEGLAHLLPPDNVFTVDYRDTSLIPGLKRDMIKMVAEQLEYTNVVFLDDNINNVNEVALLDGVETIDGAFSVAAIQVDARQGIEDVNMLERANRTELEYNRKAQSVTDEPIYSNNAEAVAEAMAEIAEVEAEVDLIYSNRFEAVTEEPIYSNNPEAVAAAALESTISSPVQKFDKQTSRSLTEQFELFVQVAKKDKKNPLYKENLSAAKDALSKHMNSLGQADSVRPAQAPDKSNPIIKFARGIFKTTNTSKGVPKQNEAVQQKSDVLRAKRIAALQRIKSQEIPVRMTVQDLFIQVEPDSPTMEPGSIILPNNEGAAAAQSDHREHNFLAELNTVLSSRQKNEHASALPDLSAFKEPSVALRRKSPPLHRDAQNPNGKGHEIPKKTEIKPNPYGRKM
ncbi:hypothetical protein [Flavobacterium sp. LAR06]|uniref:hypothetical protein n=1 Tax=Flavobacterium sp. LAR06 TaxID=3064897 RepID=UPI0035C1063A